MIWCWVIKMGYDYVPKVAIWRTKHNNQNYMLCITGPTGSGKSYTAMAISLMIDDAFDIDRVCFTAKDFIQSSNMNLPSSSVIMFDEAGIEVSSREWYSDTNKAINQVVETFRRDNLICIFTTPVFTNLDKKTRHYFHGHMEVLDPSIAGWGACKYFNLITDPNEGKILRQYPKVKDNTGRRMKMEGRDASRPNMRFPDPRKLDEGLVEMYEEKKKRFTEKVKQQGLLQLESKENTIKWEVSQIVGHLAHNTDEYNVDSKGSYKKQASRIYTRLKTKHPELKISKSDVSDAVLFIQEDIDEARSLSSDPFESGKSKSDDKKYYIEELNREKHYDIIRTYRMPPNSLSHQKIAKRLGIPFKKYYDTYRTEFWDIEEDVKKARREIKNKEKATA